MANTVTSKSLITGQNVRLTSAGVSEHGDIWTGVPDNMKSHGYVSAEDHDLDPRMAANAKDVLSRVLSGQGTRLS